MTFIVSIFLGSVFGVLLSLLWRHHYSNAYVVKGPSSRHIQKTIYYDNVNKQHYKFKAVPHVCPPCVDVMTLEHSSDDESE